MDYTLIVVTFIGATTQIALAIIGMWMSYKFGYHNGRSYEAIAYTNERERHTQAPAAATVKAAEQIPAHGSGNPGAGGTTYEVRKLGDAIEPNP